MMMYHRRGYRPCFHHISVVVLLLNILIMLSVYYIPIISAFTIQNRYQHNSVHYNSLQQQYHPSRRYQHHYNSISRTILSTTSSNDDDINDEEEEEQLPPIIDGYNLFDDEDRGKSDKHSMTELQTTEEMKPIEIPPIPRPPTPPTVVSNISSPSHQTCNELKTKKYTSSDTCTGHGLKTELSQPACVRK